MTPLSESDVDDLVFGSQVPVIVYVTGDCCPVAKAARREFLSVASELQDQIAVYEVNGLRQKELISRLRIKAMPSLLFYTSGIEQAALLGFYHRDELRKRLWSIISDRS